MVARADKVQLLGGIGFAAQAHRNNEMALGTRASQYRMRGLSPKGGFINNRYQNSGQKRIVTTMHVNLFQNIEPMHVRNMRPSLMTGFQNIPIPFHSRLPRIRYGE